MRKAKLAFLLPTIQVAVAVALIELGNRAPWPFPPHGDELYVPAARMVCLGINAPAWMLTLLVSVIPLPKMYAFSLRTEDFILLVGVFVVWYLIGRRLDRGGVLEICIRSRRTTLGKILVNGGLLVLSGLLLNWAIQGFRSPGRYNNPLGNLIEAAFSLAWAVALTLFSGRKLLGMIRTKRTLTAH
jgi:hypothetical protein